MSKFFENPKTISELEKIFYSSTDNNEKKHYDDYRYSLISQGYENVL